MPEQRIRYRAIFVSDFHLGSASCDVDAIRQFLALTQSEYLYLVGDIIDTWVAWKKGKWSQSHTNVIRTILGKTKHGTQVFFTPGNHDAGFRKMLGAELGNLLIENEFIYETLDGRKFLVTHGDMFDSSVTKHQWLAISGAWIHEIITGKNIWVNKKRSERGLPPKDTSSSAKKHVKALISALTSYPDRLTFEAENRGLDGVICGHIHKPAFETNESGVLYVNAGDWMSHCTFFVEHLDGRLELLSWSKLKADLERDREEQLEGVMSKK